MEEILEKLSREQLVDFLTEYAKTDARFANAFNVFFCEPEFNDELAKIEDEIDYALEDVYDYRRHDSWGYCSFDVRDILAEILQRTEQGHVRLAFAELELLYRKLLACFEYQGECEISDEAEYCLELMLDIAGEASAAEDKEYIFRQCLELADLDDGKDYGADYEDRLLGIAAKFVTKENHEQIEEALERFDTDWRAEAFKLVRLEVIQIIDGEDAARGFIVENLDYPKIREIAFNQAVANSNFNEAERLCVEAPNDERRFYGVSPWLYRLFTVHEMTGDLNKMIETAERILLSGDVEYYSKLKSLLIEQGSWENTYPELLHKCGAKLSYTRYMDILTREGELALLLEQVESHKGEVYGYGRLLAEAYPSEIRAVFISQINEEAEEAYGRDAYREVCSHISCFVESGYALEAAEMVAEFKLRYKRRPAFVDELNKLEDKTG